MFSFKEWVQRKETLPEGRNFFVSDAAPTELFDLIPKQHFA